MPKNWPRANIFLRFSQIICDGTAPLARLPLRSPGNIARDEEKQARDPVDLME
ncbi:MAG: hypothetical protein ACJA06_001374 [Halocynthiibacter sp.]|jgi:hypothetical protein